MLGSIEKEIALDMISEADHLVLQEDDTDLILDVFEAKNDNDEEDF